MTAESALLSTEFDQAYKVAWSPDGTHLAIMGSTGSGSTQRWAVAVYDASTRKLERTLPVTTSGTGEGALAFSKDGRYLAGGLGIISIWDAHDWHVVREILGPFERGLYASGGIQDMSFAPDDRTLAVFYKSVIYPETVMVRTLADAEAIGRNVRLALKDLSTYWDRLAKDELPRPLQSIWIFDVTTGARIASQRIPDGTREHSRRLTGNLTYTPDGAFLVTASHETLGSTLGDQRQTAILELRNPSDGRLVKEIRNIHIMDATALAVSPDSRYVATGTTTLSKVSKLNLTTNVWTNIENRDPIRLWDIHSGAKAREYGPIRGAVRALTFDTKGEILVSCQTDLTNKETVWLWDFESTQVLARLKTSISSSNFSSCAMSPDGRHLALPIFDKLYLFTLSNQ